MYEGIYLVFIRSLCILLIYKLSVILSFIFFNIKFEYNITLRIVFKAVVFSENLALLTDRNLGDLSGIWT